MAGVGIPGVEYNRSIYALSVARFVAPCDRLVYLGVVACGKFA